MSEKRIMIVEDEATVALDLKYSLTGLGYDVVSIEASGEEAVIKASKELPNVVLMDIHLRDEMDGIEAANLISSRFEIPVVFLTAFSDDDMLKRAKRVGSFGYLVKPCQERELYATIEMALYKAEVDKKNKQLEAQLRQAQKLEGFSTMAGSIAHNFNNILQITKGYANLAQGLVLPESDAYEYLQKIDESIERATEISQLMLLYVGSTLQPPQVVNLSSYLKKYEEHLRSLIGDGISFSLDLSNADTEINIDKIQIKQLILNLFMNGIEAIGDKNGSISILTDI